MRTYVITGANGFVGNNLIRSLNAKYGDQAEIRALVRPGSSTTSLTGLDCDVFRSDVTKPETLDDAFRIEEQTLMRASSSFIAQGS